MELELEVGGNEWDPLAGLLLVDIDEILDIDLSLVVLGVGTVPFVSYFVMSNVVDAEDTTLLKVPFHHLGAEDVVRRALNGVARGWVTGGHHSCVAAHLHGAGEDYTLVV